MTNHKTDIRDVMVYGSSGFGREVVWLATSCREYRVVGFVDDNPSKIGTTIGELPVTDLEEARSRFPRAGIVVAVGNPQTRATMVTKAEKAGFDFESLMHPNVLHSESVRFGHGIVICAGCILTTDVVVGEHVQINLNCTIGHDAVLEEFATLAPGVHISGWVSIGRRVYVGTGAVVINGTPDKPVVIGDDAIIGAGACVTASVPAGETWGGVPARRLRGGRTARRSN